MTTRVRPSPIAGQWYPAEPSVLASVVERLLKQGRSMLPPLPGTLVGLIAPHAGITYSGSVAGRAFAAVMGRSFSLVALVGPMHYPYLGPILTTAHQAYATPLGEVPVDHELLRQLDQALQQQLGWGLTYVAEDPEHSLEMELPFLQQALACQFRLLPLMLRTVDPQVLRVLGRALAWLLGQEHEGLLVASTDLSHYFPQEVAQLLDQEMIRRILALDPEAVLRAEEEGRAFACGRAAVAAVLWAAQELGVHRVVSLGYATSGDASGDYSSVVGYYAAALLKP